MSHLEPNAAKLANAVPKLTCTACGESNSKVVDSRYKAQPDAIIRRRVCLWCGESFETEETVRRSRGK